MFPPPHLSQSRSSCRGFTLIELLVVITIIGILASLLLPVMSKMRDKGDSTASVASMRQLGVAMSMVAGENNYNLPIGFGMDTTIGALSNFQKRLSYANATSAGQFGNTISPTSWVPLFRNKTATVKQKFTPSIYPWVGSTPYGVNAVFDRDVKYGSSLYGNRDNGTLSTLRIPNPANTVYLADTFINPLYGGSADGSFDYLKANVAPGIAYRHPSDRAALLFADWHITLVTKAEVDANKGKWFDPALQ